MERVFGEYLIKCKVIPEPEAAPVEDEHEADEKPAHEFYE